MDVKAIREQGNFLYSKSSQYMAGIFVITWTITGFLEMYVNYWIGLAITLLIAPIELGMFRALAKAYNRKGRDIKTKEYVLAGLKEYPKTAPIFVGKKVFIWGVEIAILLIFTLLLRKISIFTTLMQAMLSGDLTSLLGTDIITAMQQLSTGALESGVTIGCFAAVLIAEAVGFVLNIYYTFTFFYAVDRPEMDVWDCLKYSRITMQGNVWNYIRLCLGYLFKYIIGTIIAGVFAYEFVQLAYMCQQYTPDIVDEMLIIAANLIDAFIGALVPAILYKIKYMMSLHVMFKKLEEGDL